MIQFLQPTGLWAMAGVMIPVIVHLWNDRRGKVLRIGSVALLTGASRRAAWSPRLTEIGLLVLRCLLVMVLAVLLAGPYRVRVRRGGMDWVLVDADGGGGYRERIDSLVKAGHTLQVMDSGVNYYEAFRRIDTVAPEDVRFLVFTPDLVSRFSGTKPPTDRKMDWELYTPADSVTHWVEDVWRTSSDSILVLRSVSRKTGTGFRRERVAFRGTMFEGVNVDTAALAVVVAGSRQEKEYMQAALKALGEYTGRRVRVVDSGARVIRWQPEWSEAAWDGRLPVVLGKLLFERRGGTDKDRRGIDVGQLGPERPRVVGQQSAAVVQQRQDLRPVLWGMVFVLFVFERIKAIRDGRQKA